MRKKDIYKPIRNKIEEWIWYDDHKPAGEYYDNVEAHEEYRRWHDRDCVLTEGCLEADTMFSLWLPLRHTIVRINDMEVIRQVGNIYSKYDFLRELIGGNNLQKLLPASMPITVKLSTLFVLGMGRENVFILPDRQLNSLRERNPYWDYVPAFLRASFPGGEFASYWSSPQEHLEWIRREHFQVFFDGNITPENIRDLSGAGNVMCSLASEGMEGMERMLDHYIRILRERKKYFTKGELTAASRMDVMFCKDKRIQKFSDRVARGEKKALAQMADVMRD